MRNAAGRLPRAPSNKLRFFRGESLLQQTPATLSISCPFNRLQLSKRSASLRQPQLHALGSVGPCSSNPNSPERTRLSERQTSFSSPGALTSFACIHHTVLVRETALVWERAGRSHIALQPCTAPPPHLQPRPLVFHSSLPARTSSRDSALD